MTPEQVPQRMRFQWWRDIPRNVSRREYEQYQLMCFGAIATGMFSIGSLMMAVTGLTLQTSKELAEIPAMTVAEAVAAPDQDLVKISGYLVGKAAPTMPDEPALKVLRGNLKLTVRDESLAEDVTVETTLLEWSDAVEQISLTDNQDSEIPFDLDLEKFPISEVEPEFSDRPNVKRSEAEDGERRPSHVEYGDELFELDPVKWRHADSAFTELERELLPYGQAVVVVAGIKDQQLIDPLGDRLRIEFGTEEEIKNTAQKGRFFLSIFWLPLGGASYFFARQAIARNREFVYRSNEN
ncbi:hypothetical protein Lepto7376_2159 [[Leptolyngbya] sp. PCC 7376]|uniref:hypothetical protein n=1 Tax=[Leptolyngbya] sp. PCC 7376 TaxID=111781 RepID=UPI00029ECED6|nr:hypothetical protein [[Leptolyngbya] sp. PCC 7376]AFY38454.1 hypothetical protein Lepto7376_2159 [[Leptolyngbya] sp. PCC 7376]